MTARITIPITIIESDDGPDCYHVWVGGQYLQSVSRSVAEYLTTLYSAPWDSIDQNPPKLAWPGAPGWPPADAINPPEPSKPATNWPQSYGQPPADAIGPAPEPRPFAPELPVTVNDEQDEWHGRDGIIIGQPADERGLNQDGRWDVGFEGHDGKADPTQRRVYREDQLRRR